MPSGAKQGVLDAWFKIPSENPDVPQGMLRSAFIFALSDHIHPFSYLQFIYTGELQIRGGIEDNSKIIFLISQPKHTL